jgi:hypothetical protein
MKICGGTPTGHFFCCQLSFKSTLVHSAQNVPDGGRRIGRRCATKWLYFLSSCAWGTRPQAKINKTWNLDGKEMDGQMSIFGNSQ